MTQLTAEQIQQYLAQMRQSQGSATNATPTATSVATTGAVAADLVGLDKLEFFEKGRQMYQFLGRFTGKILSIESDTTSPTSPHGQVPRFITRVNVVTSTNPDLPPDSDVAFVKLGGMGMVQSYYQQGVVGVVAAILGKEKKAITVQDVEYARSIDQPHTGHIVGWDCFSHTSKKTGKVSSIVEFFTVSQPQ